MHVDGLGMQQREAVLHCCLFNKGGSGGLGAACAGGSYGVSVSASSGSYSHVIAAQAQHKGES